MFTITSLVLIFIMLWNTNVPLAMIAKAKEPTPKNEVKKETQAIVDEKGGFILEENSIKVINPKFVKKKVEKKVEKKVLAKTIQKRKNIQKISYSRKGSYRDGKLMTVSATAYSSTVGQCDSSPFTTASGTRVHFGTIAANFLPFGTKIKIPDYFGNQIFVVEDRMSRRYWHKIDVWMPTYKQAIQFGRKNVKIVILD
jgi:3D (Asp-Asp-Asp) domain-containing protein